MTWNFFLIFLKKIIDYEIDSDDEWEDEPEGESIADSDKGEEDDEVVDEDDDDGFFVPHGHLSDDELDEDERTVFKLNPRWNFDFKKAYSIQL